MCRAHFSDLDVLGVNIVTILRGIGRRRTTNSGSTSSPFGCRRFGVS